MFQLHAWPQALNLECPHFQEHPALSLCLAHPSAMGWTKTLGYNTLKVWYCTQTFQIYGVIFPLWFQAIGVEWEIPFKVNYVSWEWKKHSCPAWGSNFHIFVKNRSVKSWAIWTPMGELSPEPLSLSRKGSYSGFTWSGRSSNSQELSWERPLWICMKCIKVRRWRIFQHWLKERDTQIPLPCSKVFSQAEPPQENTSCGFAFFSTNN